MNIPIVIPREMQQTAKLRIPTPDPYAFAEIDLPSGTSPKEAKMAYDEYFAVFNGIQKVSETEFTNRLVDVINSDLTEWGSADAYQDLNPSQMAVFQALKRFRKRLKYATGDETYTEHYNSIKQEK